MCVCVCVGGGGGGGGQWDWVEVEEGFLIKSQNFMFPFISKNLAQILKNTSQGTSIFFSHS